MRNADGYRLRLPLIVNLTSTDRAPVWVTGGRLSCCHIRRGSCLWIYCEFVNDPIWPDIGCKSIIDTTPSYRLPLRCLVPGNRSVAGIRHKLASVVAHI